MAATRGTVQGVRKNGSPQNGLASRLGHGHVEACVATWRTFAYATVWADGRVEITVVRNGVTLHRYDAGAE